MGAFRRVTDRRQITLFPATLDEYVGREDNVRALDTLVDDLDLSAIESSYSSFGRPAYAPRMLVKVLLYGKMRGIRSSRELARALDENVRFMWLANNEKPDFRTLSEFRKRFHRELAGLLKQTIGLGIRSGLIDLGHVTVDGTALAASAGRRSFRKPQDLEKDLARLEKRLERSFAADVAAEESGETSHEDRDDWSPPGGVAPEDYRKKIREALAHYKEIPTHKKGKLPKQVSLTDPASRFMKSNGGTHPSYNGQVAVDVASGMVVGGYATNAVSDNGELPDLLQDIESNTGRNPEMLSADKGYSLKEGLAALQERGIDGYIPQRDEQSEHFGLKDFAHDEKTDTYRCPAQQTLRFSKARQMKRKRYKLYVCDSCENCSLRRHCMRSGSRKHLYVSVYQSLYEEMRSKTRTTFGRWMARIRASTVEPVFGHLKANRKLRSLGVRGLARVDTAWKFELAAFNLERLIRAGCATT